MSFAIFERHFNFSKVSRCHSKSNDNSTLIFGGCENALHFYIEELISCQFFFQRLYIRSCQFMKVRKTFSMDGTFKTQEDYVCLHL